MDPLYVNSTSNRDNRTIEEDPSPCLSLLGWPSPNVLSTKIKGATSLHPNAARQFWRARLCLTSWTLFFLAVGNQCYYVERICMKAT